MRKTARTIALVLAPGAAAMFAVLLLAGAGDSQTPPAETRVVMDDFMFRPAEVTVTVGSVVTWVYQDDQCDALSPPSPVVCPGHNSTSLETDASGQPLWRTPIMKGQGRTASVTMNTPGRLRYVCEPHQGPPANMRGFVNVLAAPGGPPPTTPPPPPPSESGSSFSFAEGTVRPGFQEYVTLQNAGASSASDAVVDLAFQAADDAGAPVVLEPYTVAVPAGTRVTIDVNQVVRSQGVTIPIDVSILVTSKQKVLAERPIYFNSALAGGVDGGSTVIGASRPSPVWNFAEGTVRPGFQEYLTFQNPMTATASVTVTFQASDDPGNTIDVPPMTFAMSPRSRVTRDISRYVADAVGDFRAVNVSARVVADSPIVAERPLYFNTGLAGGVRGGTTAVGATDTATSFLFAEGTVRPGFAEFVTLQNPGVAGSDTVARLSFQAAADDGRGVPVSDLTVTLPAGSRRTVNVNEVVAAQGITEPIDVSVQVTADRPILAERPLYFRAGLAGGVDGGSDVVGATRAAVAWSFAEGTVRPGFQEYLTLQNPTAAAVGITITFQAADDNGNAVDLPPMQFTMSPRSRVTRDVTAHVAGAGVAGPVDVSARVTADAAPGIVAERALYFRSDLAGGVAGGTAVVGAPG